jgi:hypothetical protein
VTSEKITVAAVKEALEKDKKKASTQNLDAAAKSKSKKQKPKRNTAPARFPMAVRINDYGWLGFRKPMLEALGWHNGQALTPEGNSDGSVTLRERS